MVNGVPAESPTTISEMHVWKKVVSWLRGPGAKTGKQVHPAGELTLASASATRPPAIEEVAALAEELGLEQRARLITELVLPFLDEKVSHRFFSFWERHGFHITPVHFYQPIPDTRELGPEHGSTERELPGIDLQLPRQLELLRSFSEFRAEYGDFSLEATSDPQNLHLENGMFEGTDALALYCMIRLFQPSRIIEVGAGYSTLVAQNAALRNGHTRVTSIEPFPPEWLNGLPGIEIKRLPIQEMDLEFFETLDMNDILFVDSSHVVKTGGDVNFLILEVLPRLRPGVIVHFHDIFLPFEFPRHWIVEKHLFWTEQYLLQAFLTGNNDFEILLANALLGARHQDEMRRVFPRSNWWGGASFWIRRSH